MTFIFLFFGDYLLFGLQHFLQLLHSYISLLLAHGSLKYQQFGPPWKKFRDPCPRLFFGSGYFAVDGNLPLESILP